MRGSWPVICVALLVAIGEARGDRLRTLDGSLSGEVIESTREGVTIERNGRSDTVPADRIVSIIYDDEPAELSQARFGADNGAYLSALEKLGGVERASITDPRILEDLDYYRAYCLVRLAIAGQGDAVESGRTLTAYVRQHGDSHHYYAAVETLGDLWLSIDKPKNAERMYGLVAKARTPALAMRGAVLLGRLKQETGDHRGALREYDVALEQTGDSPGAVEARSRAALGKGISQAALGKLDEGLVLVRNVIQSTGEEAEALRASAYNALGRCYLSADKPREALFAFLVVDTLYSEQTESHAESLYYLAPLWDEAGKADEAQNAHDTLRRKYPQSTWARREEPRRK